ncbi:MAG TPA: glucose-6-phosphate dehydrogenase [Verrucomicrobiae bacterium]|jgi:glucose-6-phosphate 1-dehydrogenase|nr:glucose-6-phosphate dehydrogenase [Verrucomicrobiae bacterium]
MTDTAVPKRRKTSSKPDAPAVGPETAPDKTPHPAPRAKDAPRTMRELRIARQGKRKAPPRQDDNPLREGLRLERVPDPSVLVLFGATGDLAHRKVIPALYQLWRTNLLPHEFVVLAIGRRDYDDDSLRTELRTSLEKYSRVLPVDDAAWRGFSARIRYQKLDFANPADYDGLVKVLDGIDKEQNSRGNHLYYLATQPSAFAEIVAQLGRVGLDHELHEGGWRRVVIEKPFGHDLNSAIRLNREVGKVFRESQVYRIDHYLGKETVRNLLVFRFGNGIFEPIWNRRHIDHIQITVAETIGVENRGAFYEETGASRDFLQNHLLQLMSLVAMEPPATFDADALRDEKVKVIRAIGEMTPDQMKSDVVRGQYGPGWVAAKPVQGYRSEPEVDPESETETYIAARFEVDDWRWSGVPFYLRTGKRLPKRATEIAIQFKEVPHRLFRESGSDPDPNLLAIRIQPDEGIMLRFGAKVPGLGIDVRSVTMDFTYGSAFTVDSPDAYETLILDALLGDASLFTRADEVEGAWARVTPIIDTWMDEGAPDFPNYEAGTWGPDTADELLAREGRKWRRI